VRVLSSALDEGLGPEYAVGRPRIHPVGRQVHAEPEIEPEAVAALEEAGYDVRVWDARHHYFGGVSLLGRDGGGADPRRSGSALSLP
jgi:gamma-glutamyltranspeptidase/glutathione hydrolase